MKNKTFQGLVKESYDAALADIGLSHRQFLPAVEGSVASNFSDQLLFALA